MAPAPTYRQFESFPQGPAGLAEQPEPKPRCRVCHRRLRSVPWKDLRIGPVCARKQPQMLAMIRDEYQRVQREAEFDRVLREAGFGES